MSSKFDSQIARAKGQGAGTNLEVACASTAWNGTFRRNVRGILVVSDNDAVPADSFRRRSKSLAASNGFPVPSAERTVARAENFPPLVVLMIPAGQPGSLETLCLLAAFTKWPNIQGPIDALCGGNADKRVAFRKTSKGAAAGSYCIDLRSSA